MQEAEFKRRLKALQQEVTDAYLKGYAEARDRAQWNLTAAYEENERLRLQLVELREKLSVAKPVD
jgi:regulator of replication initiation timing